eukprot:9466551-Pyramimonas_sp.AAC.1
MYMVVNNASHLRNCKAVCRTVLDSVRVGGRRAIVHLGARNANDETAWNRRGSIETRIGTARDPDHADHAVGNANRQHVTHRNLTTGPTHAPRQMHAGWPRQRGKVNCHP